MSSPSDSVLSLFLSVFVSLVLSPSLLPYTVPCMYSALGFVVCMWKPVSSLIGSVYHMLEFVGGVTVCLIVACRIRQFQRRKWPKVRKPVSKSLWVWTIILLLVHRIQCHQATTLSESPFSRSLFNFLSLECIYFCLACMIAWLVCRGVYLHENCLKKKTKKKQFCFRARGKIPSTCPHHLHLISLSAWNIYVLLAFTILFRVFSLFSLFSVFPFNMKSQASISILKHPLSISALNR